MPCSYGLGGDAASIKTKTTSCVCGVNTLSDARRDAYSYITSLNVSAGSASTLWDSEKDANVGKGGVRLVGGNGDVTSNVVIGGQRVDVDASFVRSDDDPEKMQQSAEERQSHRGTDLESNS